jgi:hypothetical protein
MDEFVNRMVQIYYSDLDTKIRLTFDVIDFNLDGKLSKEEIKLFLTYAEIWPQDKIKRSASVRSN